MHAQHALLTAAQQETQAALSALHTAREEASVTEEQLQEALQVAQEELVMVKQELVSVKKEHAEKKKDMLTLQSRMEVVCVGEWCLCMGVVFVYGSGVRVLEWCACMGVVCVWEGGADEWGYVLYVYCCLLLLLFTLLSVTPILWSVTPPILYRHCKQQ